MQQMLRDSPAAMYPCFYDLLELSILLENVAKDKELRQVCERNLALLASAFTMPSCVPAALAAIYKVLSIFHSVSFQKFSFEIPVFQCA